LYTLEAREKVQPMFFKEKEAFRRRQEADAPPART
jgi:hypothetical protein